MICLTLSGFFSCSETALFSLSKSKIKVLQITHPLKGNMLEKYLSDSPRLLITTLIGNMFVNIFATSSMERMATGLLPQYGLQISILAMTFFIILFGEIIPKVLAVNFSVSLALFFIPYVAFFYKIVTPLRSLLYSVSNKVITYISGYIDSDLRSTHEEIRAMILDSHQAGILFEHERRMIDGAIKLQTLHVKDIMTPRPEMVFFDVNASKEAIFKAMRRGKFSRIPIYEGTMDNIIGILYSKDFLLIKGKKANIRDILRKPYFVPETKFAAQLFHEMREAHTHIAIVVDEYGGVEGLISMEDILEEIFGDILDKKDALLSLKKISPHTIKVSGQLSLEDFNEVFKTSLEDDLCITIGGYLLRKLGRIPCKGEQYSENNLLFNISLVKKNRIEEIIVTRIKIPKQKRIGKTRL
jgi:CBS domain containing-hemolysin-like protein